MRGIMVGNDQQTHQVKKNDKAPDNEREHSQLLEQDPDTGDTVAQLQAELLHAKEREARALADYRNLMRRTQEEKLKMIKMAARDVVDAILQPLEHLYLAKEQLKDPGLSMVYTQFQQALEGEGLKEIECVGQGFNEQTMEVVDKQKVADEKQVNTVIKVMSRGYTLHGDVIRHAKVVIGIKE